MAKERPLDPAINIVELIENADRLIIKAKQTLDKESVEHANEAISALKTAIDNASEDFLDNYSFVHSDATFTTRTSPILEALLSSQMIKNNTLIVNAILAHPALKTHYAKLQMHNKLTLLIERIADEAIRNTFKESILYQAISSQAQQAALDFVRIHIYALGQMKDLQYLGQNQRISTSLYMEKTGEFLRMAHAMINLEEPGSENMRIIDAFIARIKNDRARIAHSFDIFADEEKDPGSNSSTSSTPNVAYRPATPPIAATLPPPPLGSAANSNDSRNANVRIPRTVLSKQVERKGCCIIL